MTCIVEWASLWVDIGALGGHLVPLRRTMLANLDGSVEWVRLVGPSWLTNDSLASFRYGFGSVFWNNSTWGNGEAEKWTKILSDRDTKTEQAKMTRIILHLVSCSACNGALASVQCSQCVAGKPLATSQKGNMPFSKWTNVSGSCPSLLLGNLNTQKKIHQIYHII